MAKPSCLIFIALAGLTIASATFAEVIYIDANSPNDPGTGTAADPFRRIQDAIDDEGTDSGDIIQIQPGVYTGYGNRDLDTGGLEITIRGQDPNNPDIIAETIIDCNGTSLDPHYGFYIHSGEGSDLVISGLTIRNAHSGAYDGGAISCENTSPTIKNCIITNNKGWSGGGIAYYQSDSATLTNCTFVRNSSIFGGGGLYLVDSHVVVRNSIFWDNYLDDPQNNFGPQMLLEYNSNVTISYTDLQGYQDGISSDQSINWLLGNISADPNFGSFSPEADPDTWDFHLQSEFGRWDINSQQWATDLVTSPCIDAGDPNSDYAKEPWPHGGRINMGAYGGTRQGSMNGNKADFNIDGVVNLVDFAGFAKRWLSEEACIEDLTGEGQINSTDLAIFAYNWLWQTQ